MKYMLLVYGDENALTKSEYEHCLDESIQLVNDIKAKGKYLAASPLRSTKTATSVRIRDGKRLITDGPFAETKEQLGGFYLIDADHLDEALEIAARIPPARWGTIEVRPVADLPSLPSA